MDGCWEVAEAVLHPAFQDARVPGLVEGAFLV